MREYRVTRKLQVTIPKELAERIGIRPGDSVAFDETESGLEVRKVREAVESPEHVASAAREFANDMVTIRPQVRAAEKALVEGLSRYFTSRNAGK